MAEELEGLTEEEFSSIDSWVIAQVDDWNDHYRQNYEKAFEIFEEVKLKSPELVGQVSFIESMGEKPSKYKKFD